MPAKVAPVVLAIQNTTNLSWLLCKAFAFTIDIKTLNQVILYVFYKRDHNQPGIT